MKVNEIADVSTGLSATPPSVASFSVPVLLVDDAAVPLDRRYIITNRAAYQTDLTSGSDALAWATILWGQDYNPEKAYIGRWISTASSPYFVCGSPGTDIPTWVAVATSGDFAITDGTDTEEFASGLFTAVTSLADIAAILQTEVQTATTITSLQTATVTVDSFGRFLFTDSTTGAAAPTISVIAPTGGAGTDITTSDFLNISENAFAVAGIDAEDLDDALAAILALDDTPFIVHQRGGSIAQKVDLATAVIGYRKVCELVDNDPNSKDSQQSSDVPYQLSQLSNNNTHITYTEHIDQSPDAAINGQIYMRPEGSASVALNGLTSVFESGLDTDGTTVIPLTVGERTALEAKGCDYLVRPSTIVHCRHGLTAGGVEMRHRIGFYWSDTRISEGIYAYLLSSDVVTFSDDDIRAIGDIAKKYLDILVERKVIEPGFNLNLPSASDISAATKATHTLTLQDVAALIGQLAVNDVVMTMTASV
jgi:hypothetical protein